MEETKPMEENVNEIALEFADPNFPKLIVGLGWEPNEQDDHLFGKGEPHDLDLSCVLLGANNNVIDGITPQNKKYETYKTQIFHSGDNLSGGSHFEDETIEVQLQNLDEKIERIVFFVSSKSNEKLENIAKPYCNFMDAKTLSEFTETCLKSFRFDYLNNIVTRIGKYYVIGAIEKSASGQWFLKTAYAPELKTSLEGGEKDIEAALTA